MQVEGSLSYPFVRKAFALAFVQHLVAETFPCHVVTLFVELLFVKCLDASHNYFVQTHQLYVLSICSTSGGMVGKSLNF